MKRFFATLRYFASDAWDEWRHSPGVNLLAVMTLAAVLFVGGLVLLVLFNVGQWVEGLRGDVRVQVYLLDGVAAETRNGLRRDLAQTDGVARVDHVDKDEALRRYRESFGERDELIRELGYNPLPESLEVFLSPGPQARDVARLIVARASGAEGVEEVRFDQPLLDRVEATLGLARWGGAGVAVLVFIAVVFVMASVLRLAVYARRDEIDIMLLVGATPAFVRGPFLIAGAGQGVLASVLAVLMVEISRRLALSRGAEGPLALLHLIAGRPLAPGLVAMLLGVGLAVSVAGAFLAARQRRI